MFLFDLEFEKEKKNKRGTRRVKAAVNHRIQI